jgi:glycerol uptake facilitator-like aquaporin
MIQLESFKPKITAVLLMEGFGVSLLVAAFNLTTNILAISMVYFICVLLTYEVSAAQLNPAITFALYL